MSGIVIRERVYIPASKVRKADLERAFEHDLYDKEAVCQRCENLEARPNDICGNCPNYNGHVRLWDTWVGPQTGQTYVRVPKGHLGRVQSELRVNLNGFRDLRAAPPFRHPLRFTGRLYREGEKDSEGRPRADQVGTVKSWLRHGFGLIRAQPRTGKTVMATFIACHLGLRTLIIADQQELLTQFYNTWMGNFDKNILPMTNAPEIERRTGQQVVGIVRNLRDLATLDVALMNYQKFIRDNAQGSVEERIVAIVQRRFGLFVVDEAHGANAHAFATFINRVDSRHTLALTATDKRKDGREFIVRDIMGPVTAVSNTVAMVPEIEFWETGIKKKGAQHKTWHGTLKFLRDSKERQAVIVRQVFADLRAGHKAILIPLLERKHQNELVKAINQQAAINRAKRGESWPEDLAVAFHGTAQRERLIDLVDDERRPTVLVSIRKMIRQGIDFKRPTMMYVVVPMSGKPGVGAPLFDQLANRVCTPVNGKRQPVIRVLVDDNDISRACATGLFEHEIRRRLKAKPDMPIKYAVPPESLTLIKRLVADKGRRRKGSSAFEASEPIYGADGNRKVGW